MKIFTRLLLLLFVSGLFTIANGQLVVSWETFPSTYNTGLSRPVNTTFQGSIGMWGAYSDNGNATLSVSSQSNALQILNYKTTGSSASSTATATSPTIDCYHGCVGAAKLSFLLQTAQLNQANNLVTYHIEVSGDGGTNWTKIWSKTGQDLINLYGSNTFTTVSIWVPANFITSTFRYRVRGTQSAGCSYDNNIIIDDIKVTTYPCSNNNLTLGNLVWNDKNGNGIRETGEPGLPNVSVYLYKDDNNDNVADGAAIKTTTTDANGNYTFTGLNNGNYIVGAVIPTGFVKSNAPSNNDPDNDVDNDNNGVNLLGPNQGGTEVRSLAITLAAATEPANDGDDANGNLTLDIAFCPAPATNVLTLGNMVWNDKNGNGIRETGEPGLPNVTVYLYMDANNDNIADSAAIRTTTTDANGYYTFTNLNPGNYIVGAIIPTGFVKSNSAPSNDPDNNIDDDNNGVNLQGPNQGGTEVRSNAITLAAGTEPTTDGDGANGNLTLDIAFCPAPTTNVLCLGNLVWNDKNGNGQRDAGEPGLPNITVYLYTDNNGDNIADSSAIRSTVTDANGAYNFSNLAPGNYIIGITIPTGFVRGYQGTGANDPDNNVDNDNNGTVLLGPNEAGSKVRTYAITLAAGTEPDGNCNNTLDIGICLAPTNVLCLGNLIWRDNNGNGQRDAGEPGLANVTVYLYTDNNGDNVADSVAIRSTVTDSAGMYNFSNLNPGNYLIGVTIPQGLVRGYASGGANDPDNNIDNDNNGTMLVGTNGAGGKVRTYAITLAAGTEPNGNCNYTLDIGLCPAPTNILKLGNLVWNDKNLNNVRDAGEPGVPNATVKLYKDDNNDNIADGAAIATTTTDANGAYLFSNLYPGNYIVGVIIPQGNVRGAQSDVDPDNNVDNDNNGATLIGNNAAGGEVRSMAITLAAGTEPTTDGDDANGNLTLDIALCESSMASLKLGNLVWNDKNLNNVRDAGEPGIANATVKLYKDDNNDNVADGAAIATTTTDANGAYLFTNLYPGNYIVGVIIPQGNVRGAQSNIDPDNDVDNDNNGVNLIGNNSAGGEVRSLAITLAVGAEPTNDGDDANGNLTLDIALCEPSTGNGLRLGNQVWNDRDGDGKRDLNEPAIANATVNLYTDNNGDSLPDTQEPIAITTSDASGKYLFTNLAPGRYIVAVPILPGYQQSPNNSTQWSSPYPDNNVDNDNNLVRLVGPNGPGGIVFSNPITLSFGDEPTDDGDDANGNLTFDCALCGNSWIINFVWYDVNGNGIQDAGEPGINGVDVVLTFEDGTTATSTSFNYGGDGYVEFRSLGPGQYKQTFPTTVDTLVATSPYQGTDGGKDSDPTNGVVYFGVRADQSEYTVDAGYKRPSGNLVKGGQADATTAQSRIAVRTAPVAEAVATTTMSVYPNPTFNYFTLKVNAKDAGAATVRITDASGKLVSSKKLVLQAGTNVISVNDLERALAGTYNIEVNVKDKTISQKLVLLNK